MRSMVIRTLIVLKTFDCFSLDILVFSHKEWVRELNMNKTISPYTRKSMAIIVKTSFIPYAITLPEFSFIEQEKPLKTALLKQGCCFIVRSIILDKYTFH